MTSYSNRSVHFTGFCFSSSVTKTVVHFYPSSGGVNAPYEVQFALSVFGGQFPPKRIILDGARVSHPDGVVVSDVFPEVSTGMKQGFFGLGVEMATDHPRGDLRGSQCIIEISSPDGAHRYHAKRIDGPQQEEHKKGEVLAVFDGMTTTSLVLVNPSPEACRIPLSELLISPASNGNSRMEGAFELGPYEVREFSLAQLLGEQVTPAHIQSCGDQPGVFFGVSLPGSLSSRFGTFGVFRDGEGNRLVSVVSI